MFCLLFNFHQNTFPMPRLKLLLLFFFPLLLSAQEKVLYNARIFTADENHPFAEAIAINGKKIVAVGRTSDVKKAVSPSAEMIDCNGNFLMPGLVDINSAMARASTLSLSVTPHSCETVLLNSRFLNDLKMLLVWSDMVAPFGCLIQAVIDLGSLRPT